MKFILSATLIVLVALYGTPSLAQSCNIRDFLLQDVHSVTQSGQTELAFVLTSTQEEWEKAKTGIDSGADVFGLFSGNLNYQQSRDKAQSIAASTSFSYENSYDNSYFDQTVWPGALDAYTACVNGQDKTAGFNLWLDKRQGDYLTFLAHWIGTNVDTPSTTITDITVGGATVVVKPVILERGVDEKFVLLKTGNSDVLLSVTAADDKSASDVVVKDPPQVVWQDKLITSSKTVTAGSTHGSTCTGTTDQDAIYALTPPGAHFVSGSQSFTHTTTDPSHYSDNVVFGDEMITVTMTQSTGACENWTHASGQLSAIERYPTAAP